MNITLWIDTHDPKVVAVSLKTGTKIIASLQEENEYGSQVLLPLITRLLKQNDFELSDLKDIKVMTGPGSYTGLRVGVSVAQALGFALNIPVNGQLGKPIEISYTKS